MHAAGVAAVALDEIAQQVGRAALDRAGGDWLAVELFGIGDVRGADEAQDRLVQHRARDDDRGALIDSANGKVGDRNARFDAAGRNRLQQSRACRGDQLSHLEITFGVEALLLRDRVQPDQRAGRQHGDTHFCLGLCLRGMGAEGDGEREGNEANTAHQSVHDKRPLQVSHFPRPEVKSRGPQAVDQLQTKLTIFGNRK